MLELSHKKVLVIGLGVSGRAAAEFLLHHGANVTGVDRNADLLKTNSDLAALRKMGLVTRHENDLLDCSSFDFTVVSPGVPTTQKQVQTVVAAHIPVFGEIELACRFLKNRCVGITGTNGKTTVTLLVTHVLNENGIKARAVGNVGTPLTAELLHEHDLKEVYVLELSSYQLETLESQFLDAAVILNITPDHLDRYVDMNDYAQAKIRIGKCLKENGKLYVENKCYQEYRNLFDNQRPFIYGYEEKTDHNKENNEAACALCQTLGVLKEDFERALQSFKKPPHRIEYVATINGVDFIDDSKGTNIDAVIRAVESCDKKCVLIAGGVDKGSAYTPWIAAFAGKVKGICAIGQAADKIKKELSPHLPVELFPSLDSAVKHAASLAGPGEVVMLSPGCSSFDMFDDYVHRGNEFKKSVKSLSQGEVS